MNHNNADALARRHGFRFGKNTREPLARAVGLRAHQPLHVVDATGGLGRDAFLLASLGATVTVIERVDQIYHQLADTLARAATFPELRPIVGRMSLVHADARTELAKLSPAIVYLDPMHPERKKNSLVKKNMRDLRSIVGSDEDSGELIRRALETALHRVVLKWPRKAGLPDGVPKPSHQILGKTVRYDVFILPSSDKKSGRA